MSVHGGLTGLRGRELAAHHELGQLGGGGPSGSRVATVVPARMTVMASATDSTSSSLWEMKMIVMPSAFSSLEVVEELSTSCGTSTAVGSSRIRIRAPR